MKLKKLGWMENSRSVQNVITGTAFIPCSKKMVTSQGVFLSALHATLFSISAFLRNFRTQDSDLGSSLSDINETPS